jgi:hypothetical protein
MSSLEDFLADLIGPETMVVLGDTGATVNLATFLALAAGELDDAPITPPKRDTPEYRETITHVAETDEMDRVVNALGCLHDDYGWRGPADVMAEWALQIERTPVMADQRYRDMTGAVDLRQIIVIDPTEEQTLRIAADKQQRYQEERGLPPHEAFREALADTERGLELGRRWYPYLRAALAAAHTTRNRRAVLAEIFKAPGRKDRDELIRGAMLLATVAYGARHHDAITARYEEIGEGKEATHDPAISPGWNAGGGYMKRSALRRGK